MASRTIPKTIPVIDLFTGPGGLSCGFVEKILKKKRHRTFEPALSIEFERSAHQTVLTRTFVREYKRTHRSAPSIYAHYRRGEASLADLFAADEELGKRCAQLVWLQALGGDAEERRSVHQRIRERLGKADQWVLLGGPPCQAYSVVGRARRTNDEQFSSDGRHMLYREYLEIVALHNPAVFVMENVKGILSSTAQVRTEKHASMFEQILEDLQDPWHALADRELDKFKELGSGRKFRTYKLYSFVKVARGDGLKPHDYVIRAEKYGIPQKRHRVIVLGVRNDLEVEPKILVEASKQVTVAQALKTKVGKRSLPRIRSRLSGKNPGDWAETLKREIKGFAGEVRDKKLRTYIRARAKKLRTLSVETPEELQHNSRSHMASDLARYFFVACYAKVHKKNPLLKDFPPSLLPNHVSAKPGEEAEVGTFVDRFKVQMGNHPSSTVTAHISKDGHYYIHPDPMQCRSLSVREAALLQTFPPDYHFEGNQTDQYRQIGNAVPPKLAAQLSYIVSDIFDQASQHRAK